MSFVDALLRPFGLQTRSRVSDLGPPRDPVLAEWWGALAETAAGIHVTPNNARECVEVDACVGLNEDTVATVPLDLFERTGADTRERRPEHPLHGLLHDEPNGWQTSAEFRQMLEGWRNTHGKGCARIISTTRGPQSLEPMHPDTVRPFGVNGGVAYRWNPPEGGPERILLQHEVLHLRGGPPKRGNIYDCESKVNLHRDSIGLVQACGQYLGKFFSGGAVPKFGLSIPAAIGDESAAALRAAWERRHQGAENMRRVAIFEGGIKPEAIGMTNDDAQIIPVLEQGVAQIARTFGVPLHLIGETSKQTSWGTGIEQQSIGFVTYYMRPKFVIWEQALNKTLMSKDMRKRFFFEFNMDGLLRGDFKTRMEGFALMIQWGLSTPNEIRKLMNLPPVEGGDERLHPLNMAPASRIMDVLLRETSKNPQTRDLSDRDAADLVTRALAEIISQASPPRLAA